MTDLVAVVAGLGGRLVGGLGVHGDGVGKKIGKVWWEWKN